MSLINHASANCAALKQWLDALGITVSGGLKWTLSAATYFITHLRTSLSYLQLAIAMPTRRMATAGSGDTWSTVTAEVLTASC